MPDIEVQWRCLHREPLPMYAGTFDGMSNFDHSVDDGVVDGLARGDRMADYAGWDFHAYVYLGAEGLYVADVHVYQAHADFVTASTPEGLMEAVSNRWGWD